jgi:hypothetical protein
MPIRAVKIVRLLDEALARVHFDGAQHEEQPEIDFSRRWDAGRSESL